MVPAGFFRFRNKDRFLVNINTDADAVSPPTTNGGGLNGGRPYTAASQCSPDYASSSAGGYIDDDRMSFESRLSDTQKL